MTHRVGERESVWELSFCKTGLTTTNHTVTMPGRGKRVQNKQHPQSSYQEDGTQTAGLGVSHQDEQDKRGSLNRFGAFRLPALPPESPQPSPPGPASATSLPAGLRGKALSRRHRASAQHLTRVPESTSSPSSAPYRAPPTQDPPRPPLSPSHRRGSHRRASGALKTRSRKGRDLSRKSRAAAGRGLRRGREELPGRI